MAMAMSIMTTRGVSIGVGWWVAGTSNHSV
jgi:hypothetical protein